MAEQVERLCMQGLWFRRHDSRWPQPLWCDAVLWSSKAACRRHRSHCAKVGPGMTVKIILLPACMTADVHADNSALVALPRH